MATSIDLPAPIAAYFKARNDLDVDGSVAPFAQDAVVEDEDEEYRGVQAIRSWVEETTRKYHAKVEPRSVVDSAGTTIVSGLVSGDFPGSPILLDHAFTLSGASISRLAIG
jgi:SnoaL-like domain